MRTKLLSLISTSIQIAYILGNAIAINKQTAQVFAKHIMFGSSTYDAQEQLE